MTTAIERLRAYVADADGFLSSQEIGAALDEIDALRADRDRLAARVAELEARAGGIAGEMMALRAGVGPLVRAVEALYEQEGSGEGVARCHDHMRRLLPAALAALAATDGIPKPRAVKGPAVSASEFFGDADLVAESAQREADLASIVDADPCPVDEETLDAWSVGRDLCNEEDHFLTGVNLDAYRRLGATVSWLTRQLAATNRRLGVVAGIVLDDDGDDARQVAAMREGR